MELIKISDLDQEVMKKEFMKAIGDNANLNLFLRSAQTEMRKNPQVLKCDKRTVLGALMNAAQLRLLFGSLGQAYLVPYYNKKKGVHECQFQIGYKGFLTMFYRSYNSDLIEAREVYVNDDFDYQFGTNKYLNHREASGDRGQIIKFYSIANLGNHVSFEVMSADEVDAIKDIYSKTTNIWNKWYALMGRKTVLKRHTKILPFSVDLQQDIARDETVMYYQPEQASFETEPDRADFEEIEENTSKGEQS